MYNHLVQSWKCLVIGILAEETLEWIENVFFQATHSTSRRCLTRLTLVAPATALHRRSADELVARYVVVPLVSTLLIECSLQQPINRLMITIDWWAVPSVPLRFPARWGVKFFFTLLYWIVACLFTSFFLHRIFLDLCRGWWMNGFVCVMLPLGSTRINVLVHAKIRSKSHSRLLQTIWRGFFYGSAFWNAVGLFGAVLLTTSQRDLDRCSPKERILQKAVWDVSSTPISRADQSIK